MKRPAKKHTYDDTLLVTVLILVLVGLILLTSTSAYNGRVKFHDSYYYLKKQGLATVLGMAGMLWIARIDYHRWIPLAVPGYLAAIGLSIAVMAFGKEYNGSKRWLSLGPFSFQPSEFAKVAVILFLAWLINRNVKKISKLRIMSGMMLSILPIVGLVGASNLSTAIIIFCITAGLIFVAHPDTKIFLIIAGVGIALAVVTVIFLNATVSVDSSGSFRIRRILVWLHPEDFADDAGYQTIQALYAIGSGGFFGRGLGNSIQKLGSVPEAQNDMIFSIICEELGIFGGIIVLLLYAYLLYRLFFIAQNAPDMFGSLMVSGIFIHMALQVILNIAVVVNLMPNTGITLPFISYGGTSILFLMAEMGLALSVARKIKFEDAK